MPGVLRHNTLGLKISVHVDDLLVTGTDEELDWLQSTLAKIYQMKFQRIGHGHDQEAAYLNRTIRWTCEGIEWVPHPRHVQTILRELNLDNANPVTTPLTNALLTPSSGELMDEKSVRNTEELQQ